MSRNFQVFDALEFLAEVTQHIPNKGQHLIHYWGWYSNKKRGMPRVYRRGGQLSFLPRHARQTYSGRDPSDRRLAV